MPYSSDSVDNEYGVPEPEADMYERHDLCLSSLWRHYVQVCRRVQIEQSLPSLTGFAHAKAKREIAEFTPTSDDQANSVTKRPRLQVFQSLSAGGGPTAMNSGDFISAHVALPASMPAPLLDARIAMPRSLSPALSASSAPFTPAAAPALQVDTPVHVLARPALKGIGISSPVSVSSPWDCLSPQSSQDSELISTMENYADFDVLDGFEALLTRKMPLVQSIATNTNNRLKALVAPSASTARVQPAPTVFTPVPSIAECNTSGTNAPWKHLSHTANASYASSLQDRGNTKVGSMIGSVSHLSIDTREPLLCPLLANSPIDLSFIGVDDEVEEEILSICEASKGLMSSSPSTTLSLPRYPAVSIAPMSTAFSAELVPVVDEWADTDTDDEGGDSDGDGDAADEVRTGTGTDGDSLGSETIFGYFPLLGQQAKLSRSPSFTSDLNRLSGLSSMQGSAAALSASVASANFSRASFTPVGAQNLHSKSRSVYGVTQKISHSPALRDAQGNPPWVDEEDALSDWVIVRESPRPHIFRPIAKQALKPASGQYVFPSF